MKKMVLLVLVVTGLVGSFVAKGQTEYLVTVDPATGAFTKVNSLPGITWLVDGSETIDNTANSYVFQGGPIGDTTFYLCSADNTTGIINSKALFPDNNGFENLLYIDSLKAFYGTQNVNGLSYLVSINISTGVITTIKLLANFSPDYMTYNHNLNQLIFFGVRNGSFDLRTVDANTGNTISDTLCPNYYELNFDNTTNQLYGMYDGDVHPFRLGIINTTSGQFSAVYDFPVDENIESYENTFDEKDQDYIAVTEDTSEIWHLYFINVTTGKVVYRNPVETYNGPTDNVVFYRYDNTTNILYALHWEAHTFPVTLLSFTATKQATQNLLQWATTQEVNSSYFGVERSGDGVNFTGIGQLDASGNSSVGKSYSLIDNKPINGTNYYRLKMVDEDGKFSYSGVRTINEVVGFEVSIYPNPVVNKLNLNISSDKAETVQLEVVDNGGKVVVEKEMEVVAGVSTESINVGGLSSGEYYVRVVGSEGEMEEKFVKE